MTETQTNYTTMGKTTVPAACVKGGMAPFSGRDHSRGFHISDCPMQVWEQRYMENNQKNCMSVVATFIALDRSEV